MVEMAINSNELIISLVEDTRIVAISFTWPCEATYQRTVQTLRHFTLIARMERYTLGTLVCLPCSMTACLFCNCPVQCACRLTVVAQAGLDMDP